MKFKSLTAALAAFAVAAVSAPASAAQMVPFDTRTFAAAQAQGRPILVDIYAEWCATCRVQGRHMAAIVQDRAFADLVVFKLNYDSQKEERRRLGVTRQSTLIAFNGRRETGRVIAQTDRAAIHALIRSALR